MARAAMAQNWLQDAQHCYYGTPYDEHDDIGSPSELSSAVVPAPSRLPLRGSAMHSSTPSLSRARSDFQGDILQSGVKRTPTTLYGGKTQIFSTVVDTDHTEGIHFEDLINRDKPVSKDAIWAGNSARGSQPRLRCRSGPRPAADFRQTEAWQRAYAVREFSRSRQLQKPVQEKPCIAVPRPRSSSSRRATRLNLQSVPACGSRALPASRPVDARLAVSPLQQENRSSPGEDRDDTYSFLPEPVPVAPMHGGPWQPMPAPEQAQVRGPGGPICPAPTHVGPWQQTQAPEQPQVYGWNQPGPADAWSQLPDHPLGLHQPTLTPERAQVKALKEPVLAAPSRLATWHQQQLIAEPAQVWEARATHDVSAPPPVSGSPVTRSRSAGRNGGVPPPVPGSPVTRSRSIDPEPCSISSALLLTGNTVGGRRDGESDLGRPSLPKPLPPQEHPLQAMQRLLGETWKYQQLGAAATASHVSAPSRPPSSPLHFRADTPRRPLPPICSDLVEFCAFAGVAGAGAEQAPAEDSPEYVFLGRLVATLPAPSASSEEPPEASAASQGAAGPSQPQAVVECNFWQLRDALADIQVPIPTPGLSYASAAAALAPATEQPPVRGASLPWEQPPARGALLPSEKPPARGAALPIVPGPFRARWIQDAEELPPWPHEM